MSEFPCQECGSLKRFHKRGCSLKTPIVTLERGTAELPKVGEWFVLRFFAPMSYSIEQDCKTYALAIELAPVAAIYQYGKDWRVEFDVEHAKQFWVNLEGDLFTRADQVAKALREMADKIELGVQ